jgi:hypothetical protein
MHSPPIEWALGIGYLAVLDVVRDRGDPDGDTLSECVRDLFRVHRPEGRAAFGAAVIAGGLILHRHICKETP